MSFELLLTYLTSVGVCLCEREKERAGEWVVWCGCVRRQEEEKQTTAQTKKR